MKVIQETKTKLFNLLRTYCKEDAERAVGEAEVIVKEFYNALGGCNFCAGKGYNLETYGYCEHCDRGAALEQFVKHLND